MIVEVAEYCDVRIGKCCCDTAAVSLTVDGVVLDAADSATPCGQEKICCLATAAEC